MSRYIKRIFLILLLLLIVGVWGFFKYDGAIKFNRFATAMENVIANINKDQKKPYSRGVDMSITDKELGEINITKDFEVERKEKIELLKKRIDELEQKKSPKEKFNQLRAEMEEKREKEAMEAETLEDEENLTHSKIDANVSKLVKLEDLPEKFRPFKKYLHEPFKKGACMICHDGDASIPGKLVTKKNIVALCYKCHPRKNIKKYSHKPVEDGKCFTCHDPHQSNMKKLLKGKSVNNLCLKCHNEDREDKSIEKVINMNKKYKHEPAEKNCLSCHEHHGSEYKKLLKSEDAGFKLCISCHNKSKMDKKVVNFKNVKYQHGAIRDKKGKRCLACHDPHASSHKSILKKNSVDVCLDCHNEPVKSDEDGKMMMNMEKHLQTHKNWHGPIAKPKKEGGCSACHNPHGSNHFSILKESYTKKFYGDFNKKGFICFECHELDKVKKQYTTKDTDFRDGKVNLHYLHVNERKGRTCRACHDEHASKKPKLIRDYTIFNNIKFPLRYIETKNGGSCQPACHKKFSYDRVNPIDIGRTK